LWDNKGSEEYIYAALKIDLMKVSHETGSEANCGDVPSLMPFYPGMGLPKAAFFSFWIQPVALQEHDWIYLA